MADEQQGGAPEQPPQAETTPVPAERRPMAFGKWLVLVAVIGAVVATRIITTSKPAPAQQAPQQQMMQGAGAQSEGGPNAQAPAAMQGGPNAQASAAMQGGAGGDAACGSPTGQTASGPPAVEMGPKNAPIKIEASLPLSKHCHDATAMALQEAAKAHPDRVYLKIVEGMPAMVKINGQTDFKLDRGGQMADVKLAYQEGGAYQVADLKPLIEAELAKASGS